MTEHNDEMGARPEGSAAAGEDSLSDAAAEAARGKLPLDEFLEKMRATPGEIERLGVAFYEEKRLAEAHTLFRGLVGIDPENGRYRNALGAVLLAQGKHEEALEHLGKAITADPKNVEALANRAEANIAGGRFEEAHRDIQAAVELDPRKESPAANRARKLAWGMGELARAAEKQ
jgi:tetratricopeptide (TPR) repeat protein